MRKWLKAASPLLLMCFIVGCSTTKSSDNLSDEKNKRTAKINTELGMTYFQQHNLTRAKQKLLLALEEDPTLPEAWYSMGYLLESTGQKAEAGIYYKKATELAPGRGDAQNNLGTYLCRMGDYKGAVTHFVMATQDRNYLDIAAAYENAGLCALKIPDKQLATVYFQKALEQDNNRHVAANELKKLNG